MPAVDPQITASELLRIFHRHEPYLFLGAAFTTVAILAAAFSFLRGKVDSLSIYFALFAFLYGQRLWIQAGLLGVLVPHSVLFRTTALWHRLSGPHLGVFYFSMRLDFFIAGAKSLATFWESFWARLQSRLSLSGRHLRITGSTMLWSLSPCFCW